MQEFQTSLLREKFVIHDPSADISKGPVVGLSNRVEMNIADDHGKFSETIIIRAQNMHSCVRMMARVLQSFLSGGALMTRQKPYEWDAAWEGIQSEYEHAYNPQRWIAIYNQGKSVFSKGEHHIFLDVIEKCHAHNKAEYESAIPMAEQAFKKMGRMVRIDYDGNVALTVTLDPQLTRFGVIVRGPLKTTTFSFSVAPKAGRALNFPQCLSGAAAFLEGIQLAFMVGMNEEKIRMGKLERLSKEEKQTREARQRLSRLNGEISNLENAFEVRYRPERPEFPQILAEAEQLARTMLSKKT